MLSAVLMGGSRKLLPRWCAHCSGGIPAAGRGTHTPDDISHPLAYFLVAVCFYSVVSVLFREAPKVLLDSTGPVACV